jgi:hypothetical protein
MFEFLRISERGSVVWLPCAAVAVTGRSYVLLAPCSLLLACLQFTDATTTMDMVVVNKSSRDAMYYDVVMMFRSSI